MSSSPMKALRLPLSYEHLDYTDDSYIIRDAKGFEVISVTMETFAYPEGEQVAERIVACVNACEGIATGALNAGVIRNFVEAAKNSGAVT